MAEGGVQRGDSNGSPNLAEQVFDIEMKLCDELISLDLKFDVKYRREFPVGYVYNPRYHVKGENLESESIGYRKVVNDEIIWKEGESENRLKSDDHKSFLKRFTGDGERVLLLGMNPGGTAGIQNGIAFADANKPREWLLGINTDGKNTDAIAVENPTSGSVFVDAIAQVFENTTKGHLVFKENFFVYNYCPLAFKNVGKTNMTLSTWCDRDREKRKRTLPSAILSQLKDPCNESLGELIDILNIKHVVSFGGYVYNRAKEVIDKKNMKVTVTCMLHPTAVLDKDEEQTVEAYQEEMCLGLHSVIDALTLRSAAHEPVVKEFLKAELVAFKKQVSGWKLLSDRVSVWKDLQKTVVEARKKRK